jgi:hypothetical protein
VIEDELCLLPYHKKQLNESSVNQEVTPEQIALVTNAKKVINVNSRHEFGNHGALFELLMGEHGRE